MELYKGLPLFNLDVVEEMNGVQIISLVDFPAIEQDFLKLSKDMEVKFSMDDEKRIVTGAALIPDQKIYRRNENGDEFYITFTKDAIERIAQKFFSDGNNGNVNVMHEVGVDDCFYFESYLKNDERGICPAEFKDLPDGTWFVSAKINNDKVWELIKNGVLRGFSIEGSLHVIEAVQERAQDKEIDSLEDLLDYLNK